MCWFFKIYLHNSCPCLPQAHINVYFCFETWETIDIWIWHLYSIFHVHYFCLTVALFAMFWSVCFHVTSAVCGHQPDKHAEAAGAGSHRHLIWDCSSHAEETHGHRGSERWGFPLMNSGHRHPVKAQIVDAHRYGHNIHNGVHRPHLMEVDLL